MLPPPLSAPRKLRRLLDVSVTGRSLLKLPLKLSKLMSPRALSGSRSVTSPLKVFDVQIVAVGPAARLRR